MSDWSPAAILPNLTATSAVEGDVVAFVPSDPRVQEFCNAHTKFRDFISRFTDAFGVRLNPVIQIVRNDVAPQLSHVEPLASFRDLVSLSVVPYARALKIGHENAHQIFYSNSFWLYPWMLARDDRYLVASTPAVLGLHVVGEFYGQCSPEVPIMDLSAVDERCFSPCSRDGSAVTWRRGTFGRTSCSLGH